VIQERDKALQSLYLKALHPISPIPLQGGQLLLKPGV